jgi:hypothetical protein
MQELDTAHIRNALVRLSTAQPRVFGVDIHGFRLNPPLTEVDVAAFEREHSLRLPHDYRQFLTDIGNGGAGPFYGISPLGEMDDNFGLQNWQENDGVVGVLSEPFPLQDEWNDLSGRPNDNFAVSNEAEYDRQVEAFGKTYWCSSLVNGAIPICHEGCALRVWLVVTGAQPGYLWEDRRTEYAGLKPIRLANGSLATFARWYGEWLDRCLAKEV